MTDKRETALARWSRLKRAEPPAKPRLPEDDQLPEPGAASLQSTETVPPEDNAKETPPEHDESDLPDIADLNAESDFSAFLREGVSEEIRRKALRVLWRSDPVLANLDGLNDYDEDFRSAGVLAEAVRTAYKTGKGYAREEEERPSSDDEPAADVADTVEEPGAAAEEGVTVDTASTEATESSTPSAESPEAGDGPEKKS